MIPSVFFKRWVCPPYRVGLPPGPCCWVCPPPNVGFGVFLLASVFLWYSRGYWNRLVHIGLVPFLYKTSLFFQYALLSFGPSMFWEDAFPRARFRGWTFPVFVRGSLDPFPRVLPQIICILDFMGVPPPHYYF